MPIYEYQCLNCNHHVEVIQKFSDNPLTTCERCAGQLQKVLSQSSFVLKGSGWYITDYSRKSATEAKSTESASNVCQPTAEGGCGAPACAANTTTTSTATAATASSN
jgi:putative FmdB family regulatory protein